MQEHGWLPGQIDALTLAEITVALERERPGLAHEDLRAAVGRWRRLTPRQKLEAYARGEL